MAGVIARCILFVVVFVGHAEACTTDSGGTCRFMGCDASRGSVSCSKEGGWPYNYKCRCNAGSCAVAGVCTPAATLVVAAPSPASSPLSIGSIAQEQENDLNLDGSCNQDTGGSCRFLDCDASRGQGSFCEKQGGWPYNYKCTCREGFCAQAGKCVSSAAIATSGGMVKEFAAIRHRRSQIAQNKDDVNLLACDQDTGGTCRFTGCDSTRGQGVYCWRQGGWPYNYKCECGDGYCAQAGKCAPSMASSVSTLQTPSSRRDPQRALSSPSTLIAFAPVLAALLVTARSMAWRVRRYRNRAQESLLA